LVVNKLGTYNFISLVVDFYGICYIFLHLRQLFNVIIFIFGDTGAYKHRMQQGTTRNIKCVFES